MFLPCLPRCPVVRIVEHLNVCPCQHRLARKQSALAIGQHSVRTGESISAQNGIVRIVGKSIIQMLL